MATYEDDPFLTSLGRGVATNLRTAGAAARGVGSKAVNAADYLPKLVVGNAAADVANVFGTGLAQFKSGLHGREYTAPVYEGKTFSQMFSGGQQTPAPAAPVVSTKLQNVNTSYPSLDNVYGKPEIVSLSGAAPESKPVEDTTSDIAAFRAAQYARDGLGNVNADGATTVGVTRQPNGVLSFSATGAPGATGAVRYAGLPQWTSARGGAGQGAVDTGGQAFKPAQAALAAGPDITAGYYALADKIARGEGGPVGVAQNKIALAALGPILERQLANQNALATARMSNETQRYGIDTTAGTAREGHDVTKYGYDTQAATAAAGQEIERTRANAALQAAIAATKRASGIDELNMQKAIGEAELNRLGSPFKRLADGKYVAKTRAELDADLAQRDRLKPGQYTIFSNPPGGME